MAAEARKEEAERGERGTAVVSHSHSLSSLPLSLFILLPAYLCASFHSHAPRSGTTRADEAERRPACAVPAAMGDTEEEGEASLYDLDLS